jgi:hypothetical protein
MLYFHGNAEDLSLAEDQAVRISQYLNFNVIMPEYAGYGIYTGNGTASEQKIKEDAEYIYRYCI